MTTLVNRDPIGNYDGITGGQGRFRVTGWAFDQDAPFTSIPVAVYIDNVLDQWYQADSYRPDVPPVVPYTSNYQGFDEWIVTTAGVHNVCIYAINSPSGNNPQLGCKSVTVNAPIAPPAPTVSSSTHSSQTQWYSNNDPLLNFAAIDTIYGINGYSYNIDLVSNTTPDQTSEGTATSRQYGNRPEGTNWFHVHARNAAQPNQWGATTHFAVKIDTVVPIAPATVTSSSHTVNSPSSTRGVNVAWAAGVDATSGIKDYVWTFNTSQTQSADAATDPHTTSPTATSGSLSDGAWWFHVRAVDNAGNVSPDTAFGPFLIDGAGPNAPTISSSTHTENTWDPDRDAAFTWTVPADSSPITGYRIKFDDAPTTDPLNTDTTVTGTTWQQNGMTDGEHYFHVRAKDAAGNLGATAHFRVRVDGSASPAPTITSSTHPDETLMYEENDVQLAWNTPADLSGVVGFTYTLDHANNTDAPSTGAALTTNKSYTDLEDGDWWFHVRALDAAGNWGATDHYAVSIHEFSEAVNAPGSDTVGAGEVIDLPAVPDLPDVVAPPGAGALPDLFPHTGFFSSDPVFDGPILPNDNPADAVTQLAASFVPPLPPTPNPVALLSDALTTVKAVPMLETLIPVPTVATYTVQTTSYEDGVATTHDDEFPVCVPTDYSSTGSALPLDADLRINLCVDPPTSSTTTINYQLDALKPGVRADVKVTYNAVIKELVLKTEAKDQDHPATFNASLTGDLITGANDYTLRTATSSPLEAFDVQLRSFVVSELASQRQGHIRVEDLPADAAHIYTISGKEATTEDRTVEARFALDGNAVGPNESLTIEQFDPADGGARLARAIIDKPSHDFDTLLHVDLADTGLVASAAPTGLTVTGTQIAAPAESVSVEQFDSGDRVGSFTLHDLAAAYTYRAEVLSTNGVEDGAHIGASFSNGAPADGDFALARYHVDSGNEVLDGLLKVHGFAAATDFQAHLSGDPTSQTGQTATLDATNSSAVTDQLIEVVQPTGATPSRVVLVGTDADPAAISNPIAGRNLRWDNPGQSFHAEFALTEDANGNPTSVKFQNAASDAPSNGRIEVGQDTADGVAGLVIGAPTTDQLVRIDFRGTVSDIEGATITRTNHSPRPEQYLQVFLRADSGLKTQARFIGPQFDGNGLEPGTASNIDAVVSNITDDFMLAIDLDQPDAVTTRATISGTNGTFSPDMDIDLRDATKGVRLHHHSLPATYSYEISGTLSEPGGDIETAAISGDQSADNPDGLLELDYSGLKTAFRSLTPTFSYSASIDGPIENPLRLKLEQRQSQANPASLVQIAKYDGAATTPRARTQCGTQQHRSSLKKPHGSMRYGPTSHPTST